MMISISSFARALNAKSFGKANALLLGFEASARLLGNDLASVALARLGVSSTGTSISTFDIRNAWNQAGPDDRYRFLRSAFSARAPDIGAIRDLACLIRQARIGAIIATDPACALHQQLLRCDVLDADAIFHCCWSNLDALEPIRQSLGDRPIFIDVGEVLIDGFLPGILGFDHQQATRIQNIIKDMSSKYDKTICWGWSRFNTLIDRIWTSENGRYFVLGKDSENDRTFMPGADMILVDQVSSSQSLEIASLDLLRAVTEELCPELSAKDQTPARSYEQAVNAQLAPPRYDSAPLLCDERAADELIRESRQKALVVIGVDATLVRSRLATLLVRLLVKSKDMVEHETVSRLEEVTDRVTSFYEEPDNLFWVVEYAGTNDLPMLGQGFFQDLATSLTANPRLKTLLLIPIFYAEEIARSAPPPTFYAESLTFEKLFVPTRLRIWLREVFPELIDSEEEESLAEEMCRIVHGIGANWTSNGGLDRIHLALNRWRRSVVSRNQDMNELDSLLDAWREALVCFAQRSTRGEDGGDDLSVRPRSLADDLGDWDLLVASRPPSEKDRK
jgi:hypothetical protein